MITLGLSGHFGQADTDPVPYTGFLHDAAACLVRDGELVAAVEEERFNRIKKTTKFPANAIRACLDIGGISPARIDAIGYYFTESSVNASLDLAYVKHPQLPVRTAREFMMGRLADSLDFEPPDDRLIYTQHHMSHALSCYVRSGIPEALVVVMDGRGEMHSISIYQGQHGQLNELAAYGLDKSLGQLYEDCIQLLGYKTGDEYKVMGLAPYGNPDTYRPIFEAMHILGENGDFDARIQTETLLTSGLFKPRRSGEEFTQQHMDFAAGLQAALERLAMHVIGYWAEFTGLVDLCFVGGVAHNSSLNGLILQSKKFRQVFIHPASHDAGAAEGAALFAAGWLGAPPRTQPRMRSASLGPDLGTKVQIEREVANWGDFVEFEQPADIVEAAAALLADGAVIGWAQGRSEFGPRALGNRSILADARPSANKDRINAMVKKREAYRPFAPAVTAEAASTYFELPETLADYEFMSFVVDVREERRAELGAVTHVDGSARVQIVDEAASGQFHSLIHRFGELTGTPVLLNTSFNNNAEPIVQTVHDALTCYLTTGLDFLIIGDLLIRRRADRSRAFDRFAPQLRPVTRLAKRIRLTPAGAHEVRHEIYLDYEEGPSAEVTAPVFALLAAADGVRSLDALAKDTNGTLDEARDELFSLWQRRFFTLLPPAA